MPPFRTLFLFATAIGAAAAEAAALVPVPTPDPLMAAGWEPNRGQAKPEILFLSRGNPSFAMTAQSIIFSPLGVRQTLVGSNPDPAVSFLDPLPGIVNSYSTADPQKWVTGISRYRATRVHEIYPLIDAEYAAAADGQLMLRLILKAGVDPKGIVFEIPNAYDINLAADGTILVRLGSRRTDPNLFHSRPVAFQESASGRIARPAHFERLSTTRFGLRVEEQSTEAPLEIELQFGVARNGLQGGPHYATDAEGNVFVAATIPDAAGKDDPFSDQLWEGCGVGIGFAVACSDVAVYKYSRSGDLIFATYLAGRTREDTNFLGIAPNGTLIVTGSTDSSDFPVSAGALQRAYAGPAATASGSASLWVEGDFYAVKLDATTGTLREATYLGGPNADRIGETALGADGSLYFIPKWLVPASKDMPTTPGALQPSCQGECPNGYAAHLSASLDRLFYGTYLPGTSSSTAKLHVDGSLYYAGWSGPGFPVTPNAFQQQVAGREDAIVARLDPSGTRLVFGTYLGGRDTDWILRTAVAPDGSIWVHVSSFVQCCIDIHYRLVHLDAKGERIIAEKPIDIWDIATDREGNLFATSTDRFQVGPDALLANPCPSNLAYIKLSPLGELLFATYIPDPSNYDFEGTSNRGLPVLRFGPDRFEIVEGQSMGMLMGCMVDAASFGNSDVVSPGEIVTIFGSKLGPREGIVAQLQNGRLPNSLGGARVLVNGEPVPLLYASYWQVNAVLPYSIPTNTAIQVQVESNGSVSERSLSARVQRAGIFLFRLHGPGRPNDIVPAAALNQDGTVNSSGNPAKKGSIVALFGTGGGATVPPSIAGEVTPLEQRRLEGGVSVQILGGPALLVEYAGAAPAQVAGMTQINIKLPDVIPQVAGYPRGVLPISVVAPETTFYPWVTIAVEP